MKKSTRSKDFNKKLVAYSAAAGAALLAAPTAHATIQNITSLSVGFNFPGSQSFTAGPAHGTFTGTNYTRRTTFSTYRYGKAVAHNIKLAVNGTHGNQLRSGIFSSVKRVAAGASIAGLQFVNTVVPHNERLAYHTGFGGTDGSFKNGQSGYIAFKTQNSHGTYYGWLKVKVSLDAFNVPDRLDLVTKTGDPGIYGAFGLTSDDIKAGQVAPVPEPSVAAIGGLGLLALGAAGVRELRRRRKSEQRL